MRKLTYGAAVSLDGYIAGPQQSLDWLRWSEDAKAISSESWTGVDTMLIGRKTHEFTRRSGSGGAPSGVATCVVSRTMDEAPQGTELVRDPVTFVRTLKRGPGGDILVMGGGQLAGSLLEGGLIDEVGLNIHPVMLGGGTPMFPPFGRRAELKLLEANSIARGCVFLRYQIVR